MATKKANEAKKTWTVRVLIHLKVDVSGASEFEALEAAEALAQKEMGDHERIEFLFAEGESAEVIAR